ncbi:MAG: hypothetical protein Q9209_007550 [Squamulea sp. 1 TL-2023]
MATESKTVITFNPPATVIGNPASATPLTLSISIITQTKKADNRPESVYVDAPGGTPILFNVPSGKGFPILSDQAMDAAANPTPNSGVPLATPSASTSGAQSNSNSASRTSSQRAPIQTVNALPEGSSTSNNNSTSSPNQRQRNRDSNAISPGAAAGIGIGCAIAGAMIAAAILALFFRRRRRRAPARSDGIPLNSFGSVEKTIASANSISPAGMIDKSLPQPAEDQALGGEMSRLKTAIKNHVQSYYHTNSVRGSVDQVALGLIATGNMPLIASTLGSVLSNPVTRMTAIRFCITWTVVSRIDQNCEPSLSFLPPEIASCLLSINGTRDDPSTKPGFMSRWRSFTAALLQDRYGTSTLTASDPRNQNISEALQALDAVLHPFADEQRDDRERLQKLEEILKRSARFGFILFSQPSVSEFDWNTPPNAGRGTLVISPALMQVTDDNGRRLPRPKVKVLEEPELARGLESYL